MSLLNEEKETIILFNEAEKTAEIEVFSRPMKRQLEQLAKNRPEDVKLIRQNSYAPTYSVPKSWIKIRPKRILSEAQKEKLSAAMKSNLWG